MAEANTFFNEESIKITKNVFKGEPEKPEKYIGNLTSANFKIRIKEMKKLQEELNN